MANLNSTTIVTNVGSSDTTIALASVAGINPGDVILIVDSKSPRGFNESMLVSNNAALLAKYAVSNPPRIPVVRNGRGQSHGANAVVYTGPPSGFNAYDPIGVPAAGQQPFWVNTVTGTVWSAQGDEAGPGTAFRFWQLQQVTPGRGALGIRTFTTFPTQGVQ